MPRIPWVAQERVEHGQLEGINISVMDRNHGSKLVDEYTPGPDRSTCSDPWKFEKGLKTLGQENTVTPKPPRPY